MARPKTSQNRSAEPERSDQAANTNAVENSRTSLNSASLSAHSSSSSSSSSDSDDGNPAKRSQLFKRPPRFRSQRPQRELLVTHSEHSEEAEDADDHGPSTARMLPFAKVPAVSDTLRSAAFSNEIKGKSAGGLGRSNSAKAELQKKHTSSGVATSSSMASSASDAPVTQKPGLASPGPLSPRHRASLARSSPKGMAQRSGKEGSEGTPSMGSSFSDIDGMH